MSWGGKLIPPQKTFAYDFLTVCQFGRRLKRWHNVAILIHGSARADAVKSKLFTFGHLLQLSFVSTVTSVGHHEVWVLLQSPNSHILCFGQLRDSALSSFLFLLSVLCWRCILGNFAPCPSTLWRRFEGDLRRQGSRRDQQARVQPGKDRYWQLYPPRFLSTGYFWGTRMNPTSSVSRLHILYFRAWSDSSAVMWLMFPLILRCQLDLFLPSLVLERITQRATVPSNSA